MNPTQRKREGKFIKPKIKASILAALLCVTFITGAYAQLPNAWQINDNLTTSGFIQYVTNLTASQVSAADLKGWRYDVVCRLTSSSTNAAQSMAFGDGTRRFYIFLGLNASGQLTAHFLGGPIYTLTTAAEGTNYHTHELTYDPVTSYATYRMDGIQVVALPGAASSGQSNQVMWGANYSLGEGVMNYHHAQFEIMGQGIVADYNAGMAGNPAVAPTPTDQGWTRYTTGAAIPEGPVSPDTVALPSLATTLAASDVWAHRATFNAQLHPDGVTTEYHFEFGLTTNYGSFTATNTLVDGTFAGVFSNVVNGLLPNSTYHFRVVASNSTSEVTGEDMSFTTSLSTVVFSLADSGPGTLRAAVAFANTNVAGTDITFDPALAGQTIVLTSGELVLTNSASLDASALPGGIAISGNVSSRILEITSGSVTLNSLTLTNGNVSGASDPGGGGIYMHDGATLVINNCTLSGNSTGGYGGGIYDTGTLAINNSTLSGNSSFYGGGIYNDSGYYGTLTINNSTLSGNSADNGDAGGGIANVGTLTINNSTLSGNSATNGQIGAGGGIVNYGMLTINSSSFTGNSAEDGSGIYNSGTVMLNNSTLSGNSDRNRYYHGGGGIYNNGDFAVSNSNFSDNSALQGGGVYNDTSGSIMLNDSTLSSNSATHGSGGGIYNAGAIAVNNCTFTGNSAPGYGGGGIFAYSGTVTINNSTLSGNSATNAYGNGGGIYNDSGTVKLTNSIVAGNTAGSDPNIFGSFSGSHCLTNDNPLLAPLGDYGGPTQTMPPLAGSPAIDAGGDSVTSFLTTDQRGYLRLSGAHVDIGAVEAQVASADNPPVLMNSVWSSDGGSGATFQFSFTNSANIDFTALTSTNVALPLTNWTILGNATQVAPGVYQFTDPGATNDPQRFYRVVSP